MMINDCAASRHDLQEPHLAAQKPGDGCFVRRVEHRARGAADPSHFAPQREGRKAVFVRWFKLQLPTTFPVDLAGRRRSPLGPGQRILYGKLHVGRTHLSQHRAIVEFYQRMNHRLWVDHHFDLFWRQSNNQRASISSRALFIIVAESTVIFGPIRHVG